MMKPITFFAASWCALTAMTMATIATAQAGGRPPLPAKLVYINDVTTYTVEVRLNGLPQRLRVNLRGVEGPKLYASGCERDAAVTAQQFARSILWPNETLKVSNLRVEDGKLTGNIEFDGRNLTDILLGFRQVRPADQSLDWCAS